MSRLNRSLRRLREDRGQALIEYLLVLPILFLLILNLVNFGGFFYAWIAIENAARAGADYGIIGGASPGVQGTATGSQIRAVINADTASLPNGSSLSVIICKNNNGTYTTLNASGTITSGCSLTPPTDPEAASYILTMVDVTYTYQPFIGGFSFPSLGIYLSIPPTTVHQRAVMRSME